MAGHRVGDVEQGEPRRALLACQMTQTQGTRQSAVAGRPVGDHQQVVAVRIGRMVVGNEPGGDLLVRVVFAQDLTSGGGAECDLCAEHGRQPHRPGCLGESDDTVETIVIRDGQRFEPESGCFFGKLLGVRGAVEEGEVGVAMQLGVGNRR